MITIQEFLYLENIMETQSRSLIADYPNLSFESPNDFREFFQKKGIRLTSEKIKTKNEKTLLLERFKSFKNSNDYISVRKYIEEETRLRKKLKEIQQNGDSIVNITNLLNEIEKPIDPFFNFFIRKILTGSDDGVLPSEELRVILDKLIKENSKEYYDETSDIIRDDTGRISSYKNLYKNKGRLHIPILDDRFTKKSFRHTVKTAFKSLSDAVEAENSIISKAPSNLLNLTLQDLTSGGSSPENNDRINKINDFLSKLSNLVNTDANTVPGLKQKVKELEDIIDNKNKIITDDFDKGQLNYQSLVALSIDNNNFVDKNIALEETTKILQSEIDNTLKNLEQKVTKQMEEIPKQFDELTSKLDEQNKIAQKQAEDLKNTLQDLADSSKPPGKDPKISDSNPLKKDLEELISKTDKIYAVTYRKSDEGTSVYINKILDKIKVDKPASVKYTYVSDGNNRNTGGVEIQQIVYWNDTLKSQVKSGISTLTKKEHVDELKTLYNEMFEKRADQLSVKVLKDLIKNLFDEWVKNINQIRGDGEPQFKEVMFSLNPILEYESPARLNVRSELEDWINKHLTNNIFKVLDNANVDEKKCIEFLRILNEIQTSDASKSWKQ